MLPSSRHNFRRPATTVSAKSLAARVDALEAKEGKKTLEEQFREQAELRDLRFAEVNQQLSMVRTDLVTVRADLGTVRTDLGTVRTDLDTVRKDLGIVREGVSIILTRLL